MDPDGTLAADLLCENYYAEYRSDAAEILRDFEAPTPHN
jgi:hypothetical protein